MNIDQFLNAHRPDPQSATLVVPPGGEGPGFWAGAPSACVHQGRTYLAYRLRRPVDAGRGHCVVVAGSDDGVHFEPLVALDREPFGAASLERPALVKGPEDTWMLYVSCATPGSYHWWIDVLCSTDPSGFDPGTRQTVLPGDDTMAVKDPVVTFDGDEWRMWPCLHPLDDLTATDRMWSAFARSSDGMEWKFEGGTLDGRPGKWDERGARVAWVLREGSEWVAFYDGRDSAARNAEEKTGWAVGPEPGALKAQGDGPVYTSPWGSGSLRYMSVVDDPLGGGRRIYYEASLADGSHGLFTQAVRWPLDP